MSSKEIESIIQRDSCLPGLRTIFDSCRVQKALASFEENDRIDSIELDYIRYKPQVRALALFQCTHQSGVRQPLVVIAHDRTGWTKCLETQHSNNLSSRATVLLPDEMFTIEWFPRDRQLKQLVKLFDPAKTDRILNGFVGDDGASSFNWHLQPQTYKPRRRFVAKAIGHDRALAIKCYTKDDFESACRNAELVQSNLQRDMVPGTVAFSSKYRMIVLEWLPGETLSTRLSFDPHGHGLLQQAGTLLRRWHEIAQQSLQRVSWRHQAFTADAMDRLVEDVAWLLPEMRPALVHLVHSLANPLTEMERANDLIHGDFYAKQIIHHDGKMHLIDFDEIGRGHRYQDIGNFVGQLYWNAVNSQLSVVDGRVEGCIEAFLHGYEPDRLALDWSILKASIVTGILRCLPHAFRRGLPDWPLRMQEMLVCAQSWVSHRKDCACEPQIRIGSNSSSLNGPDEIDTYLDVNRMDALWRSAPSSDVNGSLDLDEVSREQRVINASLVRHKPKKRVLVQYTLENVDHSSKTEVLGKARIRKEIDARVLKIHSALQTLRPAGVIVPKVLRVIPQVNMWFQEKLNGHHVSSLLAPSLHRRIGQGLAEIHCSSLAVDRCHTLYDELQILKSQFQSWLFSKEDWTQIANLVYTSVWRLSRQLLPSELRLLHRDFYFDQVLVLSDGIGFVDWDLAAMGQPELDVGNYLAHLDEYGLRLPEHADYCEAAAHEFLEGYKTRRPSAIESNIDIWRVLSLARLAAISQRIPSRAGTTASVLHACVTRCEAVGASTG